LWSCCVLRELYNCWWKEQTFISGGIWPEGIDDAPSSVGDGTLPGTFHVLAVTVHILHDTVGLKDCLIDVELRTSIFFFYRDILWDFHMNLGENLIHTEQDLWRTFIMFRKVGAAQQEQKITLC